MEWVETTGRTVEEAKDAALDQLGVDEQDAEFEVLEEPKLGLFGRVRAEARVRARVRPTQPRAKDDRRDKRRRKPGAGSGGGSGGGGRSAGAGAGGGAAAAEGDSPADAETTPAPAKASGGGRSGGGRRGNGGGRRAPAREREEESDMSEDVALAEQADVAREFLDGLLEEFGASGDIQVNELDEDTIEVAVHGDSLGLLIGPKGNTLSALQEVTRTVVQRQTGARNGRLVIDVGGYRQKRREALERFTRQVADEVKGSGVRRVLEPMHPADRKVVHDTANTIDGVHTTSEGEEPRRRVVILPD
jgi:spoIIIJ-associated protein